eukprot:2474373-Amphidinium_carterae.1
MWPTTTSRSFVCRMLTIGVSGDAWSSSKWKVAWCTPRLSDRVQDSDLKDVRRENEQLRKEVENFMTKSLQALSLSRSPESASLCPWALACCIAGVVWRTRGACVLDCICHQFVAPPVPVSLSLSNAVQLRRKWRC